MWKVVSRSTIDEVAAFLTEQQLLPSDFHLVAARDSDGSQVFHILYLSERPRFDFAAVAQADEDELTVPDADEAVDAARAIIAGAQRDE
jgi:hypothetical protein